MSSYHPYLTDDSSDDSLMEEVSNRPQIAIKYAKRKPLKSTTKVAEESDVDPEELVDQELVRKLIDAYTEVRAEYDAEIEKHAEQLCKATLEQQAKYEIWGGGEPKLMKLKPLATDLRGVQCGRLLDENRHTIQRVPVKRLEALKRTPPMRYWTLTNVNIKTDDDYTLSHVPYLADLSLEEGDQWCTELMEAFPDGVHGTKVGLMEGKFINDKILYAMVKHVISVDEGGKIDDAELRHIMHQVHVMFPDKGSVNKLVSRFPDLQARFEPDTVRRPIMQNEKGELLASFTPVRLLNSFEALLCRRCMHYDCLHHGPDVEPPPGWRPRKCDEYEPSNEENNEPCSEDCYLNAPVHRVTTGMGVKTAVSRLFQSTIAGFMTSKDKGTASASFSPRAAINNSDGPDLSMWGPTDFNPPSKVPGWTQHEEASFNLIRVTCGDDYCRLADVLGMLTDGPKKTCIEVYEYARRTARLHLTKNKNNATEKPTGKQKSWEAWKIQDQNFRKTYANNGSKMDNQHMYVPCGHEGKCSEENGCQCAAVGNACTKFCGCATDDCRRRFPGCRCAPGSCRTKACNCYLASWECDPDVCTRCNCDKLGDTDEPICKNVSIQRGYQRKLIIAPSQVAGWGCFAADDIEKNEFICEYTGEVISHGESERRGRIYDKLKCSYLFRLNTSQDVDATRVGNLARFINHSNDPNCSARVMVVNGDHKIGIFAKRPIKRLEELFFNYAYNKSQQMEFVPLELPKHAGKSIQPKPRNDSSDQQLDRSGNLKRKKHADARLTTTLDDPDEPSTSEGSRKKRYWC